MAHFSVDNPNLQLKTFYDLEQRSRLYFGGLRGCRIVIGTNPAILNMSLPDIARSVHKTSTARMELMP